MKSMLGQIVTQFVTEREKAPANPQRGFRLKVFESVPSEWATAYQVAELSGLPVEKCHRALEHLTKHSLIKRERKDNDYYYARAVETVPDGRFGDAHQQPEVVVGE